MSDQKNTPEADSPLPEKAGPAGAFPDLSAQSDSPAWLSDDGSHDSDVWERSFGAGPEATAAEGSGTAAGTAETAPATDGPASGLSAATGAGTSSAAAVADADSDDGGTQDDAGTADETDIVLPEEPVVVAPEDVELEQPSLAEPSLGSDAVEAASLDEVTSEAAAVEANAAEAGRLSGLEPAPAGAEIPADAAPADQAAGTGNGTSEEPAGAPAAPATAGASDASDAGASDVSDASDASDAPDAPDAPDTAAAPVSDGEGNQPVVPQDAPEEKGTPAAGKPAGPAGANVSDAETPAAEAGEAAAGKPEAAEGEAEEAEAAAAAETTEAAGTGKATTGAAALDGATPKTESIPGDASANQVTEQVIDRNTPARDDVRSDTPDAADKPDATPDATDKPDATQDAADKPANTQDTEETPAGAHPLHGIDAAAPMTGALPFGTERDAAAADAATPDAAGTPAAQVTSPAPGGEPPADTRRSRRLAEGRAMTGAMPVTPAAGAVKGTEGAGADPQGDTAATAQEKDNSGGNKRLALIIGGVVLAAIIAILLFVFVFNDKGEGVLEENVSPVDVEAGACLSNWEDVNSSADVVTCETPHDAQLVATESYGEDDGFPGTAALEERVNEVCAAVDYADAAADFPDLQLTKSIPTEQTWAGGDRRVDCYVFTPEGQELTESLLRE